MPEIAPSLSVCNVIVNQIKRQASKQEWPVAYAPELTIAIAVSIDCKREEKKSASSLFLSSSFCFHAEIRLIRNVIVLGFASCLEPTVNFRFGGIEPTLSICLEPTLSICLEPTLSICLEPTLSE